jgi:hypothetical protein
VLDSRAPVIREKAPWQPTMTDYAGRWGTNAGFAPNGGQIPGCSAVFGGQPAPREPREQEHVPRSPQHPRRYRRCDAHVRRQRAGGGRQLGLRRRHPGRATASSRRTQRKQLRLEPRPRPDHDPHRARDQHLLRASRTDLARRQPARLRPVRLGHRPDEHNRGAWLQTLSEIVRRVCCGSVTRTGC